MTNWPSVADPVMGGPGGRPPPHWPKLKDGHGCASSLPQTRVESFHLNPYFWSLFMKTDQKLSASGSFLLRASPWPPTRGSVPGPHWGIRSTPSPTPRRQFTYRLAELVMLCPPWQILNPPLMTVIFLLLVYMSMTSAKVKCIRL